MADSPCTLRWVPRGCSGLPRVEGELITRIRADLQAEASQLYLNLFSDQVGFPPEIFTAPRACPFFLKGSTTQ